MCFNAFGLGALNVYWLVIGLSFAILNVLPFSPDCTQAIRDAVARGELFHDKHA